MENQIVCPNCNKTISNDPIIDAAASGNGTASKAIICECGEKITYWQMKAQFRDHRKMGWRFRNWLQSFSHKQN